MRVFAERQVIPTIYAVGMALESIVTILVVILARLVSFVALGAVERVFRINADSPRRYPGLNQRASRYYLPLRRTAPPYPLGDAGGAAQSLLRDLPEALERPP